MLSNVSRLARGAILLAPSSLLFATATNAQTVPGSLPTREQVELPRNDRPAPPSGVTVTDNRPAAVNCPFADSPIEVSIDRLRFTLPDGAAVPAALNDALSTIRPEPGKHRLVQLCDLRDAAARALSAAGYITAVTIPPQEINAGEATLIVIPARLVDVHITGSAGRNAGPLAARIDQLKSLPVLNTREIERILLGANDVPGLQVRMALRGAGTGPGQVIGEVQVSYTPFSIVANVQNSGSRAIGRESGTIRAEYYGLTGHSDRTFVGLSSTFDFREQQVVQAGHYFATDSGLSFGGRFSYAWSRPDLGGLDLRSRSLIGGVDVSAPLLRSVKANADLGGGIEIIEQRIKFYPGGGFVIPVTQDKLRVGYLRLSASKREPQFVGPDKWSISGSLELRQGFDLFGATQRGAITASGYGPSRFDGSATATVLRGGISGSVGIGRLFSIAATGQGQWASGALLSFEEFSVGNLTIGRGYDPGVTAGDKALGLRVEPRVQLPIKARIGVQAFGFYDTVHIWNDDSFTTEASRSLSSFGGGLRATLPGLASLEAMYAHPQDPELNLAGAPRASDRVLLSLTIQFAPRR
uniref:ShlB/FhaC/HecB family hemolysin secretion/activation protein n=1 Tax=Sphingomonas sp. AR_OL41 TaxID=3042729 RepID=UPI0024812F81|nr:ShlB/FhaC/HecB family hemolysin secretion/activation protein [Sphingomonas sp. AR_OL41]